MSLSHRSAFLDDKPVRASLFAGPRVQLDEQRWSASFAAQLSSWAAAAPTLVVLGGGKAMLSDRESGLPFAEHVRREWDVVHRYSRLRGHSPPGGLCAVFRFNDDVVVPLLNPTSNPAPRTAPKDPSYTSRLVQLSPAALFRYFWRRQAIALQQPFAETETEAEDDAVALLRHVFSRTTFADSGTSRAEPRQQSRRHALARAAQAALDSAISDSHPLADLARKLDTSPFHLARVFREELGVSIHQYLLELRLVSALDRLREGAPNLSLLALELGFSHHSHFSAVFRQAIGWSPREVRRMLAAETVTDLGILNRRCG